MIETKFGLKYPFPHSLVHIVDNSSYTGDLPVVVADEPSMYGAIVVTGCPVGEDQRVIDITRSDVLRVAFGMDAIGTGDIRKYGQTITYPMALLNQGGPVKMLRVTPDDATYAYSIITVEWRWDSTDNKMHVRYNSERFDGNVVGYKNKERLNAAIVKAFADAESPAPASDPGGDPWKKRAFIVNIGAGRGSAYNSFVTTINQTIQGKHAANVRYQFSTINKSTTATVEQFYASLMNVENTNRPDAIESVNVQVKRRVKGSSIVVPFVNEAAIQELYRDYREKLDIMVEENIYPNIMGQGSDYVNEVKTFLTINTFDMIFGNYIYNGTDDGYKLPYFQVDMRTNEIPLLTKDHLIYIIGEDSTSISSEESASIEKINQKLMDPISGVTAGITRESDKIHLGDVYLYSSLSSSTNPYMYIITSINQYTGLITSMRSNTLAVKKTDIGSTLWDIVISDGTVKPNPVEPNEYDGEQGYFRLTGDELLSTIKCIIASNKVEDVSTALYKRLRAGSIEAVDAFAIVDPVTNDWGLYYIAPKATIDGTEVAIETIIADKSKWDQNWKEFVLAYNMNRLFRFINWKGVNGNNGVGNMIAVNKDDAVWNRPGATVIDVSNDFVDSVYVNDMDYVPSTSDSFDTSHRTKVTSPKRVLGAPPTSIDTSAKSDILNNEYDVIRLASEDIKTYRLDPSKLVIKNTSNTSVTLPDLFTFSTGDGGETVFVGGQTIPANGELKGLTLYEFTDSSIVPKHNNLPSVIGDGITLTQTATSSGSETLYLKGYTADDQHGMFRAVASGRTVVKVSQEMTFESGTATPKYEPVEFDSEPSDWSTIYTNYFVSEDGGYVPATSTFDSDATYVKGKFDINTDGRGMYAQEYSSALSNTVKLYIPADAIIVEEMDDTSSPISIDRFIITGNTGSFWKVSPEKNILVPVNYYSDNYGIDLTSQSIDVQLKDGYTGFFDDFDDTSVEFKWRYSALLVKAYRGLIDPSIMSPVRVPAKYLFDGATNTIVGQTILPYLQYTVQDKVTASTIFTDDDKDDVMLHPEKYAEIDPNEDIDVKQAMYDFMIYRIYQGIKEDSGKRPIGPGSGLSLHLDSGVVDLSTAKLVEESFIKRFDNPNASWDIGGIVSAADGVSYTFTKRIVDNLIGHCKTYTVNKPFTGKYTTIRSDEFVSYFPDIDATDWDLRELMYNSGGNAWIVDVNGDLTRRSQRTMYRASTTSDLLQESNMRTLSQLVYLLQNKIDENLFEYDDDDVLKTLSDQVNNMFSNWVGTRVQALDITFERDVNIDGGDIVVCNCNVTFRGLILRVPIIVNVNRRQS